MNLADQNVALVLGGGGARAAYQAGFLRRLAREIPGLHFPIVTGVSAGSINAAFLANWTGSITDGVEQLAEFWKSINPNEIFQSNPLALAANVARWGARLISGGVPLSPPTRGLVDTGPLRSFLQRSFGAPDGVLRGVPENIRCGRLKAAAVTTTNYATGQSITWAQGAAIQMWERPLRRSVEAALTVEHVMASCALPLFFPAVQVGEAWHGDGGIRLTAPLSPALRLGAHRVFTISTRYQRSQAEADQPGNGEYPPPATVIGVLLNAVFLDMLDYDELVMRRTNDLVKQLPEDRRAGLRHVELLLVRPSQNLESLAVDHEESLPRAFRYLVRGLGTRETPRAGLLATILFAPEYVRRVMEIGEKDAERRAKEVAQFLAPKER